jgi:hypothetical protein
MSTSSRSAERFKYGICLNDECPLCKEKKVQQIPMRKDLVCSECGKPLRECPPPKKKGVDSKLIGIIVAVVVIGGGIAAFFGLKGGNEVPPQETPVSVVDSDSIKRAEAEALRIQDSLRAVAVKDSLEKIKGATAQPPVKSTPQPRSTSKNLGYATFKGSWPNDVNGRMVFTSSHVIDSKDPKKRVAEAGDYVIGEWSDGHLVQGIWYGADNQVKGSVIIGK